MNITPQSYKRANFYLSCVLHWKLGKQITDLTLRFKNMLLTVYVFSMLLLEDVTKHHQAKVLEKLLKISRTSNTTTVELQLKRKHHIPGLIMTNEKLKPPQLILLAILERKEEWKCTVKEKILLSTLYVNLIPGNFFEIGKVLQRC